MDGFDSNYILEEYLGTSSKNEKKKNLITDINRMIARKEYDKAEEKLAKILAMAGELDEDYILLSGYLRKSRGRHEEN